MNSAYAYAMLQDIPDTSKPPMAKKIEQGEIGFGFDENGNVCLQHAGFCPYVFKTIQSAFHKFVYTWYNRKKKEKLKLGKMMRKGF